VNSKACPHLPVSPSRNQMAKRIPWNKDKQFCLRGHDTFVCGRWKNGTCKECTREKRRKYEPGKRPKKQFCINGHDLSICGRNKSRKCKECSRLKQRLDPTKDSRITQFCPRGHDTFICGRTKTNGSCRDCRRYLTPEEKLGKSLRARVVRALKGKIRPGSAIKLLGCSIEECRKHIESLWLPGMTWENHGFGKDKWHIDHILPLDSFDLTDPEQFKRAVHYKNLQPLWQPDNLRKSNKVLKSI
jgi:hypothetical protein